MKIISQHKIKLTINYQFPRGDRVCCLSEFDLKEFIYYLMNSFFNLFFSYF
jgi:hypothetical protein